MSRFQSQHTHFFPSYKTCESQPCHDGGLRAGYNACIRLCSLLMLASRHEFLPHSLPFPNSLEPMAQTPAMNGYFELASMMGANPELAIFRRFSALNAHSLLLLQAELVFLENKLQKCIEADAASGHDLRTIYDRDWQSLFESSTKPGGCAEQWDTLMRVKKVLKEYSKTSLSASAFASSYCQMRLLFCRNCLRKKTLHWLQI